LSWVKYHRKACALCKEKFLCPPVTKSESETQELKCVRLRVQPHAEVYQERCLDDGRSLGGVNGRGWIIELEILCGLFDNRALNLAFACQAFEHCDNDRFSIGVEVSTSCSTGISKAEAIGAQGDVGTWDGWTNLLVQVSHEVRDTNEWAIN